MNEHALRTIAIVGGGTAGWMAAAALAKSHGDRIRIRLVESDEIGTIGVGEATVPHLKSFNEALGIHEVEFVKAVQGTFKLGIQFRDWGRIGDRYMHGFGEIGHPYATQPFHQCWLKLRQRGEGGSLGDYSVHTKAGPLGKFMTSASDVGVQSPLSHIAYAYHFDAGRYARFLRAYAEARGVVRTEGKVVHVAQRASDGFVESIRLESGETIEADLWLDCSGLRGLLIEQTLKAGFEDWTRWLPCDRAIAVPCAKVGPPTPYTRSTARGAGWQWRIPLQHRTGNGLVYSSAHLGDDEAARLLLGNLDGEALAEPRVIRFTTGRRRLAWDKNVIAIGLSGGFLEPLESTSIFLIQTGVARLLQLFPDRRMSPVVAARYNAEVAFEYERLRDFLILHYKATDRDDTEFWRACAAMSVPETLSQRMALFLDSGRYYREGEELFSTLSWTQVMIGQNRIPAHYHPAVDAVPDDELRKFVAAVHGVIGNCVDAMPQHEQFIARHYTAPAP
jgi:tryptophan halogenase